MPAGWICDQLEDGTRNELEEAKVDLTVEQVAEKLGRAPSTVRDWIRAGRLRAYKMMGREYRITPAALEEFIESERRGGAPASVRGRTVRLNAWRDHLPTT